MSPLLLAIGFLAGLLTIISPCILPVLPAVIASGVTTGGMRRAVAIAGGLAVTFGVVELFSFRVLEALGLPLSLREDLAVAALVIVGLGMVVPRFGDLVDRPFARIGLKRSPNATGSGLGLGATLGLLYLPCAGPILAAIATVGNSKSNHITGAAVGLTIAYCVGIAVPMFALILATSKLTKATTWLRTHAVSTRRVGGVLVLITAIAVASGAATALQKTVPSYSASIEDNLTDSGSVHQSLSKISNPDESNEAKRIQQSVIAPPVAAAPAVSSSLNEFNSPTKSDDVADPIPTVSVSSLKNYAQAPNFADVTAWLNTGGKSLSIASLRGKVVLIDFWTYSCINCLRSLPHVKAWYSRYSSDGLEVIGVHTPEFDFEHNVSDVSAAVKNLGVTYPVDVDDDYGTWNAWGNDSWPAEYVIDQTGEVRYGSIGEGDYGKTEAVIRALLAQNGKPLPPSTDVPDTTPTTQSTPESYLGYERLARFESGSVTHNKTATYSLPSSLPVNDLAYGGQFNVQSLDVIAGMDAKIELNYKASEVYLVLGGTGTATVTDNGKPLRTVNVSGVPALYTLVGQSAAGITSGTLSISLTPGLKAYDFTFG